MFWSIISIHAPRMGRDQPPEADEAPRWQISIHAPRMGRDPGAQPRRPWPRGISIHAPRMGRDVPRFTKSLRHNEFQSTRPVWGATMLLSKSCPA